MWPVSINGATLCARYGDGSTARGEVNVDARMDEGHRIDEIWLEPPVPIHRNVDAAIRELDGVVIGPGSFFTSLLPIFAVRGVREALAGVTGPVILVANLLTEGRGMQGFTAADAVRRIESAIGRDVYAVVFNESHPPAEVMAGYSAEEKGLMQLGDLPPRVRVISGRFWRQGIARHDRSRLGHALWAVLAHTLIRSAR